MLTRCFHFILLLCLTPVLVAGNYRWIDEQGNIYYSDTIPPATAGKGHSVLSKQGIKVKSIDPAITPEEYIRLKHASKLADIREGLIENRDKQDQILLQKYANIEEMRAKHDKRINILDTTILAIRVTITKNKEYVVYLEEQADSSTKNIINAHQRIKNDYAKILRLEEQKQHLRNQFHQELVRYRYLKNREAGFITSENQSEAYLLEKDLMTLKTVHSCNEDKTCNKLWLATLSFVENFSDTAIKSKTDNIIISGPAKADLHISLSASLIEKDDDSGNWIFLDLQCRNTIGGMRHCAGAQAEAVKNQFVQALAVASN